MRKDRKIGEDYPDLNEVPIIGTFIKTIING
jgi:hypothetical protein